MAMEDRATLEEIAACIALETFALVTAAELEDMPDDVLIDFIVNCFK